MSGATSTAVDASPTVSVIMIFLDAAAYIADAIDSVRRQTWTDWELVLVDDGSTDGSRAIAERAVADEPRRVRLYEHPNANHAGTGPSRNLGLRRARGRYLCFLDADDVFEPARLATAADYLARHPDVGVVVTAERYWRSWQPRSSASRATWLPDEVVMPCAELRTPIEPPVLIASTLATPGAPMPGICSVTFRGEDAAVLGMVPEAFCDQYEDQVLITRLLLERTAVVLPDCLSRYRQHPRSLTHRAMASGDYRPGRPHDARTRFLRWLQDYLRQNHIVSPMLDGALAAELAAAQRPARGAAGAGFRALRRTSMMAANLLLPRKAADALISGYLGVRRRTVALRTAAAARRAAREKLAAPAYPAAARPGSRRC